MSDQDAAGTSTSSTSNASSEAPPGSSSAEDGGTGSSESGSATSTANRNRRRRGSRGGRGRSGGGGAPDSAPAVGTVPADDRMPENLPDRHRENPPSPQAAGKALGRRQPPDGHPHPPAKGP